MRAAIVFKTDSLLERVERTLREMEVDCKAFEQPSEELENFDFIVSIGGDGTILRILQKLRRCPPIFGINTGRVGLLTHTTPERIEEDLRSAVERFEVESFPRIASDDLLALNEIAILSRRQGKMIDVSVVVDDAEIDSLRCDGFIVSTQIGSTGYAFSAGGPVVDPYLECFILLPIAPFRFGWKPYVIAMQRKVQIETENAVAIADGQKKVEVDGKIFIKKSEYPAVFFKNERRFSNLFRKIKGIS